jgi:hypothetical protein
MTTAVQFLADHTHLINTESWQFIVESAKEMEKEQIIQSYYAAVVDTEMIHEHKKFIYEGPEQYYNETYKK